MKLQAFLIIFTAFLASCSGGREPATPLQTFKTYTKAIKAKDIATMKLLLSDETIMMHQQQAKAEGVTTDDIVKNEPLFNESQTSVEFRNERINEEKATLEVKNSFGTWDTIAFIKEDGVWKIDKKNAADQIEIQVNQGDQQLDDLINKGRIP